MEPIVLNMFSPVLETAHFEGTPRTIYGNGNNFLPTPGLAKLYAIIDGNQEIPPYVDESYPIGAEMHEQSPKHRVPLYRPIRTATGQVGIQRAIKSNDGLWSAGVAYTVFADWGADTSVESVRENAVPPGPAPTIPIEPPSPVNKQDEAVKARDAMESAPLGEDNPPDRNEDPNAPILDNTKMAPEGTNSNPVIKDETGAGDTSNPNPNPDEKEKDVPADKKAKDTGK